MEEKKEIILPSKRYANAEEQELNLKLELENSESLLRMGDRDIILDIAKLYDKERNTSVNYKIYGKMKMVFRNMYSGVTDYNYLSERLYLVGDGSDNDFTGFLPYDEFAFLRRDLYREYTVPRSGPILGGDNSSPIVKTTGPTGHTINTTMTAPYQNWNVYLSYVFDQDSNYPMVYTLSGEPKVEGTNIVHYIAGDGIPFRITTGDTKTFTLTSPVPHGISVGEYIIIDEKPYYVNSIGNEIYDSKNYVITLNKAQFKPEDFLPIGGIKLGKRCLDINNITGTTSTYYVHKHKLLTDSSDYILDNVGFESPIWEDEKKMLIENIIGINDVIVERNRMESVLFDFKEPLVLSGLTNNLNYTPTEVYVTTIFRNGNGYFENPPKVGYKFNFHDTWIDEHFSGTTSHETGMKNNITIFSPNDIQLGFETFTGGTSLTGGTILNGAFVEYNRKEMKERVISESYHKITNPTTIFNFGQTNPTYYSGASATNPIGIYYQTHYRVKLRELSPYMEMAKTNDIYNLPENTIYDKDENVWRWRDLYDHGYVDPDGYGTNFPFANNMHYVKTDINFYLRNERQYTNKQDGLINFNNRTDNNLLC